MTEYVVFIGTAIFLFGVSFYIRDTLIGKTKPNRVTFFLWAVTAFIAGFAALADGVTFAAVPVFAAGLAPLLVFLASFANKNAYWQLKIHDYVLGSISAIALFLWWATSDPIVAIVFAIVGEIFAFLPTLIKTWKHPQTETAITYVASLINAGSAFLVLEMYSFSELAFPVYLIIQNITILFAIYRRRFF